jgi:hypothetical protein
VIKFGKRGIAALALTASAVVLGTSIPASAATGTDGFPILYASYADLAHHCTVVGHAVDGYEAVVCADILTSEVNSSDYSAIGQVEAYCQTTAGVTVQCANIQAGTTLYDAVGEQVGPVVIYCGHSQGACSTGKNVLSTLESNGSQFEYTSNAGCSTTPSSDHDVWDEVSAEIELPKSDTYFSLEQGGGNDSDGSVFTTGHYYVCA